MNIIKNLVPSSKYSIKCPYTMTPKGICVHNSANDASAKNEVAYMVRNDYKISFHYAIDDKEVVQGIPENRNAYHAGDGSTGKGNREYIGVEICYSKSGGSKFVAAEKNAAKFIASKLKEKGWDISHVKKHQDFSGKYCPHRTLDMGWQRFLNMVKAELDALNKPATAKSSDFKPYMVRVICSALNIRKTPKWTDNDVVGCIRDKGTYTIVGETMLGDTKFGKLKSGAGWISLGSSYVKKV